MIGVFADRDLRDQCLRRQAAFDDVRRRWSLHERTLASPARVFRTARHEHAELGGHDIQAFGNVLADLVEIPFAARASLIGDIHHAFDTRQVHRQIAAITTRARYALGWRQCGIGLGSKGRAFLLAVFEPEV